MQMILKLLVVLGFIGFSIQKSSESSPSYKAAVAEFHRAQNGTEEEKIADNLAGYVELIKEVKNQDVDIMVFPEATLNYYLSPGASGKSVFRNKSIDLATFVPEPALALNLCDYEGDIEYSKFLQQLSCEAKNADLYLVINLVEKATCTEESQKKINDSRKCAEDGISLYNTNVVFDRKGRVISRYRKFNLYLEHGMNVTATPELPTFDTDFGVKFGQFICFDICFYKPAVELVKNGVTDFVFPTMWFSQMPFETAIQVQENWAYVNEVNLLASGASEPRKGSGGSGIYSSQNGPLVFSLDPAPVRKVLVSEIRKIDPARNKKDEKKGHGDHHHHDILIPRENHSPEEMDTYKLFADNLTKYVNEKINFGNFAKKLCHDKFCCQFDLTTMELPVAERKLYYEYRAVVYSGDVLWGDRTAQVMNCAIVSCAGPDISNCGTKFPNFKTVAPRMRITHARVTGEYPRDENLLVVGTSLSYNLTPLSRERVHVTRVTPPNGGGPNGGDKVSAHLHGPPADDLHAFGLYGRDYRKEAGKSGTSILKSNWMTIASLVIIYFYF